MVISKKIKILTAIIVIAIVASAGVYFLFFTKPRADVIIWAAVLPSEEELTLEFIEKFHEQYPNITVELVNVADLRTRLLAAIPAGKDQTYLCGRMIGQVSLQKPVISCPLTSI